VVLVAEELQEPGAAEVDEDPAPVHVHRVGPHRGLGAHPGGGQGRKRRER
jgi:hypothetical protein